MPSRTEGGLRPAHQPQFPETHPILNVLIRMKTNNKSDYTIRFADKSLTYISKHADLNNPEHVKQFIANLEVSDSYKKNLCIAYNYYCQYYKIHWDIPRYRHKAQSIRIPTSEKLEQLIASAGRILSIKLRISKETGLRPVELCALKVKDIDLEQRTIYPTTAKYGASRVLKISNNLKTAIQDHIIRNDLTPNDKLFNGNADSYGKKYRYMRNALAKKLKDPTIQQIRLYDFRHYFATRLYAKTKDILFVKQQMGHRKLETTLIYTQLLHLNEEDEYTTRVAKTIEEDAKLIENGFQYVTERDGLRLFRKRK
ncbi:MAG: site-specific integrase [Candidatus Bathyarchaeota archaeon]|nr:site-specific integrase [Candidatus Bathyarchaeota archaeon]